MLQYQNDQENTLHLVERQGPGLAPFKGFVVLPAPDPCNTAHACVRGKQHCNHTPMYAVHGVPWAFRACHMAQRMEHAHRVQPKVQLALTEVTRHTADQVDAPAISD